MSQYNRHIKQEKLLNPFKSISNRGGRDTHADRNSSSDEDMNSMNKVSRNHSKYSLVFCVIFFGYILCVIFLGYILCVTFFGYILCVIFFG